MEQTSDAQADSSDASNGTEAPVDPPTTRLAEATSQSQSGTAPAESPSQNQSGATSAESPSQNQSGTAPAEPPPTSAAPAATPQSPTSPAGPTSQGQTSIAASVVQKIAGMAAREISGVHKIGGGGTRAFGGLRERIPGGGTAATSGVQVEVGEKQAAVDLDIVVEYGSSIVDIARAVRRNVINGVEQMTGLEVIEVNVSINDIHLPSDSDGVGGRAPSRVQ